jgi:hypothetical protein
MAAGKEKKIGTNLITCNSERKQTRWLAKEKKIGTNLITCNSERKQTRWLAKKKKLEQI